MALDFTLPSIHDNEDGSWGPSTSSLPVHFKDIPYAPYSKSDKISRIADWHDQAELNRNQRAQGGQRRQREAYGAGESNAFGYIHEEDEKSFSVVDSGRAAGARKPGTVNLRPNRGRGGAMRGGAGAGRGRGAPRGGFAGRGRGGGRGGDFRQRIRDSSVTVGADWELLEEIDFIRLHKLNFNVEAPEDLEQHGTLQAYDRAFDRITTRSEKPLEIVGRARYNVSTSDDPIITALADKSTAQVYATDSILSVLMCAPRSLNSWDIVLEKRNGAVFLDKRDGGPFDFITVNENAFEAPADSDDAENINSASNLSLEATYINANFAGQVIASKGKFTPSPNPFYSAEDESEPLASCLYKYRKFDLSLDGDAEDEYSLVVRAEVDAYLGPDKTKHTTIKALNEYDPRATGAKTLDWRKFLDTQKGAIVAGEMKNNSAKLARWAVQSYLAGAEMMKMGYITRANPRDAQRHSIVGVQSYKPTDFARQMNVSLTNGWGIVRSVVDLVRKKDEGKYVLVKDPNNPTIRLYKVPADAFDAEEEDDEETEA